MPIVDMHCHVLPGVDDGPASMEESIAVIREAERQGIAGMIVTPHFHPGRYKVYASQIWEVLERVRAQLKAEGIGVTLYPGQECYYYSELLKELEAGRVLTMAGSRYVLVEFDPDVLYAVIQRAVRELFDAGYYPIIAHYERYRCLYGRTERLEELRNSGAMLQMNFDRLNERNTLFHRNIWRRQLKEGYVDFLGSDTHGMKFRPLHVRQAAAWLRADVDRETRGMILTRNIEALIGLEE